MLSKEDYEYLMSPNYNFLKKEDIARYDMKAYSASQFNIYYVCANSIIFSASAETYQINVKFTEDIYKNKCSFYNLPTEINYNFRGNPTSIIYKKVDREGKPDYISFTYAQNGVLSSLKFYWHDENQICINDKLNKFFNKFFNEKIFDITVDYDQSDILDLVVDFYLNKKEAQLEKIFNGLNITKLDHINKEYANLVKILKYN
ncbi:MAG: hypothetical protein K2X69_10250 [Silvanigrellaceae bacterium]|nr:hypothetical protein [Silvanigrellaceae bacterium]